jgi:hypothetical protein
MSRRRKRRRAGGRTAGAAKPPAVPPPTLPEARPAVPPPPWHPFPLAELCVLLALGLIVAGALSAGSGRGRALLLFGLLLGSLGGLDTAIREHWAGFRSHAGLLAGAPAVLTAAALTFAHPPWPVVVLAAAAVFAVAFVALRRRHRRAR